MRLSQDIPNPRKYFRFFLATLVFTGAARGLLSQTAPQLNRDAILNHLNAIITWYRDSTDKVHAVGLPSDAIYEDNARNLAAEAGRLAFQSARAEAKLIEGANKGSNPNPTKGPSHKQAF